LKRILVVGDAALEAELARAPEALDTFPSHRDDPAIWLFSGGTTGQPKAVVQSHRSFANTTECYAKGVIGYTERDVTLSVPKLFFGYATGSNLLFPFAVGGAAVLFPEPCTAEVIFAKLARDPGAGRAGLRGQRARRRRPCRAPRGDRGPVGAGRLARHRLLAADGEDQGGLPRRVVRVGRPRAL